MAVLQRANPNANVPGASPAGTPGAPGVPQQNPEINQSTVTQTVQTPQGPVAVKFQKQFKAGASQPTFLPVAVLSSPEFSAPSGGANIQYRYTLTGDQLQPTPIAASGTVSERITAPFDHNPNTYLGTLTYTPVVSNGVVSLKFQSFQSTTLQFTQSETVTDPYTGKQYKIGYTYLGTTQYNPLTHQITAQPDIPNMPPANLFLVPQTTNITLLGQTVPAAYNISVSPKGAAVQFVGFPAPGIPGGLASSVSVVSLVALAPLKTQETTTSFTLKAGSVSAQQNIVTTTYTSVMQPIGTPITFGSGTSQVPSVFNFGSSLSFGGAGSTVGTAVIGTASASTSAIPTTTIINPSKPFTSTAAGGTVTAGPAVIFGSSNQPFINPLTAYAKGSDPLSAVTQDIQIFVDKILAGYTTTITPTLTTVQNLTTPTPSTPNYVAFELGTVQGFVQGLVSIPYSIELITNPVVATQGFIQNIKNIALAYALNPPYGAGIATGQLTSIYVGGKIFEGVGKLNAYLFENEKVIGTRSISVAEISRAPDIKVSISGLGPEEDSVFAGKANLHIAEVKTAQLFVVQKGILGGLEKRVAFAELEDVSSYTLKPSRTSGMATPTLTTVPAAKFSVFEVTSEGLKFLETSPTPETTTVTMPYEIPNLPDKLRDLDVHFFNFDQTAGTATREGNLAKIDIRGEPLAQGFGVGRGRSAITFANIENVKLTGMGASVAKAKVDISGFLTKQGTGVSGKEFSMGYKEPATPEASQPTPPAAPSPSETKPTEPEIKPAEEIKIISAGKGEEMYQEFRSLSADEFRAKYLSKNRPIVIYQGEEEQTYLSLEERQAALRGEAIPIATVTSPARTIFPIKALGISAAIRSTIFQQAIQPPIQVLQMQPSLQSFTGQSQISKALQLQSSGQVSGQVSEQISLQAIGQIVGQISIQKLAQQSLQAQEAIQIPQPTELQIPAPAGGFDFLPILTPPPRENVERKRRKKAFLHPAFKYTPDVGAFLTGAKSSNRFFFTKFGLGRPFLTYPKRKRGGRR
jgi:hypothetical protein